MSIFLTFWYPVPIALAVVVVVNVVITYVYVKMKLADEALDDEGRWETAKQEGN